MIIYVLSAVLAGCKQIYHKQLTGVFPARGNFLCFKNITTVWQLRLYKQNWLENLQG